MLAVTYLGDKVASRSDGNTPTPDTVTYSYNATGNPSAVPPEASITTVTDGRGHPSSFGFDSTRHLIRRTNEDGGIRRWIYDANGFLSQIQFEAVGGVASADTYTNDANGNVKLKQDRWGQATWSTFDSGNRVISTSTPLVQPALSTPATDPAVTAYQTTIGYTGSVGVNTVTKPSPQGLQQTNIYTTMGSDPVYPFIGGTFAPIGLMKKSTDALGGDTVDSYNVGGDLTKVLDPAGKITTYTYDELGRQLTKTEVSTDFPGGVTWTTTYDKLSRVLTQTEPAAVNSVTGATHTKRTTFAYDANSMVLSSTDSDLTGGDLSRVTAFTYDNADRQVTKTTASGTVLAATLTTTYDGAGNVATSMDALGRVYQQSYNYRNLPTSMVLKAMVADPRNSPGVSADLTMSQTSYDELGRKATTTDANGVVTAYAYGQNDQVASTTVKNFALRLGGTQDVVVSASTFDPAGNVLTTVEGNNTRRTTFTYGNSGLKMSEALDRNVAVSGSPAWWNERTNAFTYDAAGNSKTVTNDGLGVVANQVTTFNYNTSGQKTSQVVTNTPSNLTTSYTYDSRGLLKTTTDPMIKVTSSYYDSLGRMTSMKLPSVNVESNGSAPVAAQPTGYVGYNTWGETTDVKDANGNVTSHAFDQAGRERTITYPSYTPPGGSAIVPTEQMTFDLVGSLTAKVDRRGKTSTFEFDKLNRAWHTKTPGSVLGSFADAYARFDNNGNTTQTTDPLGAVTNVSFDMLGRTRTKGAVVRQPTTHTVTTTLDYDWIGNQTWQSDPLGHVTTAKFNAAGQQATSTDPYGNTFTAEYDPFGHTSGSMDPGSIVAHATFDQAGRQLTASQMGTVGQGDPALTTTFAYDNNGNKTTVTTPEGRVTKTVFDAANRPTSVTAGFGTAAAIQTQTFYDAAGNATRTRNGRGKDTIVTYQAWNLAESRIEPPATAGQPAANRTFQRSYDGGGLPVKDTMPGSVTVNRTFDDGGRVLTETGVGATGSRTFTYDIAGRQTAVSHPNATIGITYDDRGLMLTTTGGSQAAGVASTTNTFNDAGLLTTRVDAAGTAIFTYDANNKLATVTDPLIAGTKNLFYDISGHLVTTQLKGPGAAPTGNQPGEYRWFDHYGRTETVAHFNTDGCWVTGGSCWWDNYQYDKDNNITANQSGFQPTAGWNTFAYNAANQLTSWTNQNSVVTGYGYDGAGNRTTAGTSTFTFDDQNRITAGAGVTYTWSDRGTLSSTVKAGVTTNITTDVFGLETQNGATIYTYDGLGRIARRNGTGAWFAYDTTKIDPINDGTWTTLTEPTGTAISTKTGANASWVAQNLHGDITGLLNPAVTATTSTRTFDPYGVTATNTGSTPTAGFQADWTDPTSKEIWMGARFYKPDADTFTSRDTYNGRPSSPAALNRYTYANNNPVANFDPSGHTPVSLIAGISGLDFTTSHSAFVANLNKLIARDRWNTAVAVSEWGQSLGMSAEQIAAGWDKYDKGTLDPGYWAYKVIAETAWRAAQIPKYVATKDTDGSLAVVQHAVTLCLYTPNHCTEMGADGDLQSWTEFINQFLRLLVARKFLAIDDTDNGLYVPGERLSGLGFDSLDISVYGSGVDDFAISIEYSISPTFLDEVSGLAAAVGVVAGGSR